jgi:hypothetical protein
MYRTHRIAVCANYANLWGKNLNNTKKDGETLLDVSNEVKIERRGAYMFMFPAPESKLKLEHRRTVKTSL